MYYFYLLLKDYSYFKLLQNSFIKLKALYNIIHQQLIIYIKMTTFNL
jgi:hypothetical protein